MSEYKNIRVISRTGNEGYEWVIYANARSYPDAIACVIIGRITKVIRFYTYEVITHEELSDIMAFMTEKQPNRYKLIIYKMGSDNNQNPEWTIYQANSPDCEGKLGVINLKNDGSYTFYAEDNIDLPELIEINDFISTLKDKKNE